AQPVLVQCAYSFAFLPSLGVMRNHDTRREVCTLWTLACARPMARLSPGGLTRPRRTHCRHRHKQCPQWLNFIAHYVYIDTSDVDIGTISSFERVVFIDYTM